MLSAGAMEVRRTKHYLQIRQLRCELREVLRAKIGAADVRNDQIRLMSIGSKRAPPCLATPCSNDTIGLRARRRQKTR